LTTGYHNNAEGYSALSSLTTGSSNGAQGSFALSSLTTGSSNLALGNNAGSNYSSSESNNILFQNSGLTHDQNQIRIGNGAHTACYVAGINTTNLATANVATLNSSTGQLGAATITAGSNMAVSTATPNEIILTSLTSVAADNATTFSGALPIISGGSTGLTTSTNGSGIVLGGDLSVGSGGTGVQSLTPYAPVLGGSTATSALQQATTGMGTVGNILTSTGSTSLPTWQAPPSSAVTVTADSGSAVTSSGTLSLTGSAGSSVKFSASGSGVQLRLTDSNSNTITGANAGNTSLTGTDNTGSGAYALTALTSGQYNTADGYNALHAVTTGNYNTGVGLNALANLVSGSNNIGVGQGAGLSYTTTEAANIAIGSSGVAGDTGVTRIGTSQVKCFIAGIDGVGLNTANVVTETSNQLGSSAITAGSNMTVSTAANQIILASQTTITADTTATFKGNAPTISGGVTGLTTSTNGSGIVLGGDLVVANGGTGLTSVTAYAPLCGGTTTTSALQAASTGLSSSGKVLTSNGSSAIPSFQPVVASIIGNSGTATPTTNAVYLTTNASYDGQTPSFVASGTGISLEMVDVYGNLTLGSNAGKSGMTGSANVALSSYAGKSLTTGGYNVFVGNTSGENITTGSNNVAVGNHTLLGTTGSNNVAIGNNAGQNYTAGESSDILIGNGVGGTAGESNVTRIGTGQSACYISGINGVNNSTASVVTCAGSSGQLGTSVLTAGSGITINTATANEIILSSSGVASLQGDTGSALSGALTFSAKPSAGASCSISSSGSTLTLNATDTSNNTCWGLFAGNASSTGGGNSFFGNQAGTAVTTANYNAGVGWYALNSLTTGNNNACFGSSAGLQMTTARNCTAIGYEALAYLTSGIGVIAIGLTAGSQYTGSETSCIAIGSPGITGESGAIHLGTSGTHTSAYIQGINGTNLSTANVATISSTGQLGSAVLTAGNGISISTSTANQIILNSTSVLPGVTNGSYAGAGIVGELMQAGVLSSAPVTLGSAANASGGAGICALYLTPGDWDIHAYCTVSQNTGPSIWAAYAYISSTGAPIDQAAQGNYLNTTQTGQLVSLTPPMVAVSISSNTTYTLGVQASWISANTVTAYGRIFARRVR
jgi:hypothetical protein